MLSFTHVSPMTVDQNNHPDKVGYYIDDVHRVTILRVRSDARIQHGVSRDLDHQDVERAVLPIESD